MGLIVVAAATAIVGTITYKVYRHFYPATACPTDAEVKQALADLDSGKLSLGAAKKLAARWEERKCASAATALKAFIVVKEGAGILGGGKGAEAVPGNASQKTFGVMGHPVSRRSR